MVLALACCFGVLLRAGAIARADDSEPRLAIVEGKVVHGISKEPLRKAHVSLDSADANAETSWIATTDDSGEFRFADVKPGRYRLNAGKAGFLDGAYGASEPRNNGSILKVDAGDHTRDLTLLLSPGASISGRVLDPDGDPVPEGTVVLWGRRAGKTHRSYSSGTNRAGEYELDGLSAGTYYVSAEAGPWGYAVPGLPVDGSGKITKLRDLATFFPAALSLADAQAITVEAGQEQSGIDIRIQRGLTFGLKGKIAGASGPSSQYTLSATAVNGAGWTSERGTILPNGDFSFNQLPPGKHRLVLWKGASGADIVGKAEVNVADQDLVGVTIAPYKPAEIRIRVVIEGEEDKPLTAGSVSLLSAEDGDSSEQYAVDYQPRNGTYTLRGVTPGKYKLWFNNAAHSYLKSVRSGDTPQNPESVEVAEAASMDVVMTFSRNGADLSGDVGLPEGQAKAAVRIVVVPQDTPAFFGQRRRYPDLDQYSHFSAPDMPPGKYVVFAAEEGKSDLWTKPEFVNALKEQGTEVELREKEHVSVHLKLITKEETDQARKRLGL